MAARVSAIGGSNLQGVIVADVALLALHGGVRIAQWESGSAVVKRCRCPSSGVVTVRAVRRRKRWSGVRMWGIVGFLPSCEVAAGIPAVCGGDLKVIVIADVALFARQVSVASRQREVDRRAGVVSGEHGSQPAIEGPVAALAAIRWKIRGVGGVRGIGRLLPVL